MQHQNQNMWKAFLFITSVPVCQIYWCLCLKHLKCRRPANRMEKEIVLKHENVYHSTKFKNQKKKKKHKNPSNFRLIGLRVQLSHFLNFATKKQDFLKTSVLWFLNLKKEKDNYVCHIKFSV